MKKSRTVVSQHTQRASQRQTGLSRLHSRATALLGLAEADGCADLSVVETLQRAFDELERRLDAATTELEQTRCTLHAAIAEQQRVEAARQQSERFMQAILDSLPAHIAVLNHTGTIIAVNRAWRDFARANAAAGGDVAEGANYLGVCDEATGEEVEDAKAFAAGIRAVLGGAQRHFMLEYACHSPRQERWFLGQVTRFVDNDATYAVVAHEETTSRRMTEEALRTSEFRFRTLVEAAPVAIFIQQGLCLRYMNPASEAILGYSWPEIKRIDFWEIVHPDSYDQMRARVEAFVSGNSLPSRYDLKIINGRNEVRWLDVTVTTGDFEGQPSILVIAVDITNHKAAEEARQLTYSRLQEVNHYLQRGRDLLNTIINGINDGLLLLDKHGYILAVNQSFAALLGSTPDELSNRSWLLLCQPPGQGKGEAERGFPGLWVMNALRDGCPYQRRERFVHPDGTTRTLDMRSLPIIYTGEMLKKNGQSVEQVVLHVVDVTENLRVEALMIENERLSASRKLTEIVAHEVNTPLQTILTLLEEIAAAHDAEHQTSLTLAQDEIIRVGTILHQLKDTYRLPAQSPRPIALNELVERVLLLVSGKLAKLHIRAERDLAANLPPVSGHANELTQVLLNLVINAIEAMPHGGTLHLATRIPANVSLAVSGSQPTSEPGRHLPPLVTHHSLVSIEVTDTGGGIEPAVQTHIFEPFFTTREHGSGLGLFVSQKIIAQHHGTIEVYSQPGLGTTFTIYLPIEGANER